MFYRNTDACDVFTANVTQCLCLIVDSFADVCQSLTVQVVGLVTMLRV